VGRTEDRDPNPGACDHGRQKKQLRSLHAVRCVSCQDLGSGIVGGDLAAMMCPKVFSSELWNPR
jgi:hypothetical protein